METRSTSERSPPPASSPCAGNVVLIGAGKMGGALLQGWIGLGVDRYSVAVLATPAYASGSYINMLPVMYRGGTTVITRKWTPASFLDVIERERGSSRP